MNLSEDLLIHVTGASMDANKMVLEEKLKSALKYIRTSQRK